MRNLKAIICFLVVILYVGLAANVGSATNESVEGKLKEVVPAKNITLTPAPPPEPPFELDNETEAIIIDLLAKEFNKTPDEIEILSAGKTYEEDRIAVRTNLGVFTYKDRVIYPVDLRLEPKFSTEQATYIIKSKLADDGVDVDSIVFYGWGNRIFNESLCSTYYERGNDLNYHPITHKCDFYFLRSIDEEKAIYEYWFFTFNAETGEIYKQEKRGAAVFKNIKTRKDAARVFKEKVNISVDPSEVFLNPGGWYYVISLNETVGLRLYDDGTIKQQEKVVLFSDEDLGRIRVSKVSGSYLKIAIGLFLALITLSGYMILKKKKGRS